ncbi:MAG TPA: hypothetical protein DCX95_01410 [Elusimicrobia bacterium]|nr:hypothetical protein [Elusimicrobiota bacterium]
MAENIKTRQKLYREFVMDGIKEKEMRSEERFFRQGVFGSKEFTEQLIHKGLSQKWSHSGHPWKKNTKK